MDDARNRVIYETMYQINIFVASVKFGVAIKIIVCYV